jgi:translation initiation factor IF-3
VAEEPAWWSGGGQRPTWFQDRRVPMVFVNENIKAPTIVIIDEEGNNVWTYPRRRALEIAQEAWKDLGSNEIWSRKNDINSKAVDYGKYMYQKQKEEKEKKKIKKEVDLKN